MSESRNNSESRGSRYIPSYVSRPSESRCGYKNQVNNNRYNNLEDIDTLIEKLEREMPTITSNNLKINQALVHRKQKIAQLKILKDEAKRILEEEKQLRMLEQANAEIEEAIDNLKKIVKKPSNPKNKPSYPSYSCGYASESRDSGESRW